MTSNQDNNNQETDLEGITDSNITDVQICPQSNEPYILSLSDIEEILQSSLFQATGNLGVAALFHHMKLRKSLDAPGYSLNVPLNGHIHVKLPDEVIQSLTVEQKNQLFSDASVTLKGPSKCQSSDELAEGDQERVEPEQEVAESEQDVKEVAGRNLEGAWSEQDVEKVETRGGEENVEKEVDQTESKIQADARGKDTRSLAFQDETNSDSKCVNVSTEVAESVYFLDENFEEKYQTPNQPYQGDKLIEIVDPTPIGQTVPKPRSDILPPLSSSPFPINGPPQDKQTPIGTERQQVLDYYSQPVQGGVWYGVLPHPEFPSRCEPETDVDLTGWLSLYNVTGDSDSNGIRLNTDHVIEVDSGKYNCLVLDELPID